jgi:hypothetical protein
LHKVLYISEHIYRMVTSAIRLIIFSNFPIDFDETCYLGGGVLIINCLVNLSMVHISLLLCKNQIKVHPYSRKQLKTGNLDLFYKNIYKVKNILMEIFKEI